MDRRSLILLGALALAGCATTRRRAPRAKISPTDIIFQALEPLAAASGGPEGLTIRMAAGACSSKTGIVFQVEMINGAAYVAFARRRVGGCLGETPGVEIVFSRQELGVPPQATLFLLNPIDGG
ncbi:hypothetical protein P7B02_14160 [Caulobacter segnis]|uniref:hypothetical protein n=1 Tax=Caulobacter segnis TaxID=88688 RepID=UPI00240EFFF2|nr:hypothetical protein [Caulobacter segnis]MDG2522679.1 hypothetical protein [Caulobacter segnis]